MDFGLLYLTSGLAELLQAAAGREASHCSGAALPGITGSPPASFQDAL